MRINRFYTKDGMDILSNLPVTTIIIEDGRALSVPQCWPEEQRQHLAERIFSTETDIREVWQRRARQITDHLRDQNIFDHKKDAKVFYDELIYIFSQRIAAPDIFLEHQTLTPYDSADSLSRIDLDARIAVLDDRKMAAMISADHIAAPDFIGRAVQAQTDTLALSIGRRLIKTEMKNMIEACASGFHPGQNKKLQQALKQARAAGLSESAIRRALQLARQGFDDIALPATDAGTQIPPLSPVLSVPDHFIEAALTGHAVMQYADGAPQKRYSARLLWDMLAESLWSSGAPQIFFKDTAGNNAAPDPHGGFIFEHNSRAPAATINLMSCVKKNGNVDIDALAHVAQILTLTLDSFASGEARPVMLGMTNLAPCLMQAGIAYDSAAGRAMAACLAALISGQALQTSAAMAGRCGAASNFKKIEKNILQSIKDKVEILDNGSMRRALSVCRRDCPDKILAAAARQALMDAYTAVEKNGLRHLHLTGVSSSMEVQYLLSSETKDITPLAALVDFKETQGLYNKTLSAAAAKALETLGYNTAAREDIHFYLTGHNTLLNAPGIHHDALKQKGFHQAALDAVEAALQSAQHIRYVFNKWILGEDFCMYFLGFTAEDLDAADFDMLPALGFSKADIEAANLYCCGALTMDGAPHIKPEHLPVFDCLLPTGTHGRRGLSPESQIKMQAAMEIFLSGGAGQTIACTEETTIEEVQKLILLGWECGVETLKLYRDTSDLTAPAVPLELDEDIDIPKTEEKNTRCKIS